MGARWLFVGFWVAGGRDVGPDNLGDLVRAVSAGDDSAFACLYDLVSARVWAATRRVLRDRAQAEEVMQEALI